MQAARRLSGAVLVSLVLAGCGGSPSPEQPDDEELPGRSAQWTLEREPTGFTKDPADSGNGWQHVSGDVLLTSDTDGVLAVNGRTGQPMWRASHLDERRAVDGFRAYRPGTSPVSVLAGRPLVFAGWSDVDDRAGVVALSGVTGEPVWRKEIRIPADVLAQDGEVIATTGAGVVAQVREIGSEQPYVTVVLGSKTGHQLWSKRGFAAVGATDDVVVGREPGGPFVGIDGWTGDELWRLPPESGGHSLRDADFRYAGQHSVVFVTPRRTVVVDAPTGKVRAVRPGSGDCVGQGRALAICGLDGAPFAFDPLTGDPHSLRRILDDLGPSGRITAATDRYVYAAVSPDDGRVYNARSGEQLSEGEVVSPHLVGNGFGIHRETDLTWSAYPVPKRNP